MSDLAATYPINLEGNAEERAVAVADSLSVLKAKAEASFKAIADGNAKLKDLKGTSAEVVAIKDVLNAKLAAERSNVTAAALAIVKQGTSLKALQTESKNAADAAAKLAKNQKGIGDAIKLVGGPADGLMSKFESLSGGMKGMSAESLAAGASLSIATAGAAALAAGVVILSAALVAGTVALTKFIVASADTNRTLALSRQWIAGSAADSARMGDQIDRLRQKIPLTTEEFSKLYTSTRAGFDGARIGGEGILGIVTAVGAATAAGADSAAAKLREIAERSKNVGRVRINDGQSNGFSQGMGGKGELAGTGLDAKAFAESVSKTLNVPLEKAKTMLRTTGVDMETYAKAAVYASNKAFGEINAAKLISLDQISKRFNDDLSALGKGVNLEPLLKGIASIEKLFSTSTTSGYALKAMFTVLGNEFSNISGNGAPLLETAIRVVILDLLKLEIQGLKTEIFLKRIFNGQLRADVEGFIDKSMKAKLALLAVGVALSPLLATMAMLLTVTAGVAASAYLLAQPFVLAYSAAKTLYDYVNREEGKLSGGGKQIGAVAGAGSLSGPGGAGGRVGSSGPGGPGTLPVIEAPAHAAGGVVARPAAGEYFASVAPGERIVPAAGDGGGRRGGGPTSITLNLTVHANGKDSQSVAASIRASSIIGDITKAIEDALKTAAVPTQAVPA